MIQIKSLGAPSFPEEVWTIHGENNDSSIDYLYSTVSWLYRCVSLRSNSVASMPFEVRKGDSVIYEYDGISAQNAPPKEISLVSNLPSLLGRVEAAAILSGQAYIGRTKNVMGNDMPLRWYLPHSIDPALNGVSGTGGYRFDPAQPYGSLQGFYRQEPQRSTHKFLETEEVLYFWLPDYAVEIGAAKNYPAKAVLQNAGVIGSLDLFLRGYFDRGLIKATLLKYKDPLAPTEIPRVKEWWRRVFTGVKNAHATEVVRGDFETITIGDGIKELRDNVLSRDEKQDIAVGMGVPLSKLLPEGVNRATKDGDDRGYIEDTIIPEIVWIYRDLNEQLFNPMGYSIVALPQQLRPMQADEVERSQSALNYFNIGYAKKEIENMLGIYIPDELKEEVAQDQLDVLGNDASGEEKVLLNGIQIQSALSIVNAMGEGTINRENAVNMYDAFLGINPEVARQLIPEKVEKPIQADVSQAAQNQAIEDMEKSIDGGFPYDAIEIFQKYEEHNQFLRWLKNRNFEQIDITEFATKHLTDDEKLKIAFSNAPRFKATHLDKLLNAYQDKLVNLVSGAKSQSQLATDMRELVSSELLDIFKDAAGADELNKAEEKEYNDLLKVELDAIQGFSADVFANKASLAEIRENIGGNIAARLAAWANAARLFFNRGLIVGRREEEMTWRIGKTEEHCSDCLRFNGRKAKKSDWLKIAGTGFYPQSRNLECNGYNCDCFMEF